MPNLNLPEGVELLGDELLEYTELQTGEVYFSNRYNLSFLYVGPLRTDGTSSSFVAYMKEFGLIVLTSYIYGASNGKDGLRIKFYRQKDTKNLKNLYADFQLKSAIRLKNLKRGDIICNYFNDRSGGSYVYLGEYNGLGLAYPIGHKFPNITQYKWYEEYDVDISTEISLLQTFGSYYNEEAYIDHSRLYDYGHQEFLDMLVNDSVETIIERTFKKIREQNEIYFFDMSTDLDGFAYLYTVDMGDNLKWLTPENIVKTARHLEKLEQNSLSVFKNLEAEYTPETCAVLDDEGFIKELKPIASDSTGNHVKLEDRFTASATRFAVEVLRASIATMIRNLVGNDFWNEMLKRERTDIFCQYHGIGYSYIAYTEVLPVCDR